MVGHVQGENNLWEPPESLDLPPESPPYRKEQVGVDRRSPAPPPAWPGCAVQVSPLDQKPLEGRRRAQHALILETCLLKAGGALEGKAGRGPRRQREPEAPAGGPRSGSPVEEVGRSPGRVTCAQEA